MATQPTTTPVPLVSPTLTITPTEGGTRVVLRSSKPSRWVFAAAGGLAILLWTASLLWCAWVLYASLRGLLTPPAEPGLETAQRDLWGYRIQAVQAGIALIVALLVAKVPVRLLLRSAWGTDVFLLSREGWTCTWTPGSWQSPVSLTAAKIQCLELREPDETLIAWVDDEGIALTDFGTHADRLWLMEELARRYQLVTAVTDGAGTNG